MVDVDPRAQPRPKRPTRDAPPTPDEQTTSDVQIGVPESEHAADETELTPLRAHYLKKALLALEFNEEFKYLASSGLAPPLSVLSLLGQPFTPLPRGTPVARDIPFLRFMFRQFVVTFPFLASAPKEFFPSKLQPFVDSLMSRNFSAEISLFPSEEEDPEQGKRQRALAKVEKHMALLLGSAIKLAEKEEVVRLSQKDLDRLEANARRRLRRAGHGHSDGFAVNIACVRTVSEKGRVRRRVHEEFVIRTRRDGQPDLYVSRRNGDFRTLAEELRKHHPGEEIPAPPQKDRTSTQGSGSRLRSAKSMGNLRNDSVDSLVPSSPSSSSPSTPLQRERNRLTLRSYLHSLLAIPSIASSPVLRSFLTADPTTLTQEELEDSARREELDAVREQGKTQFEKEVSERVERLRDEVRGIKGEMMGPEGLTHIFAIIRTTEKVEDLPTNFRAVLEWGKISLASTIFHHFIASDSASQSLAGLKRIHGLMPYFVLKGILRISNPVGMIRGVMDLFLAQPFGGRSLLQRMFTSSLTEEVKALEEEIEAVKDKIDDPVICEKIRAYVYAPKEIQDIYKADAIEEKVNLLSVILRSSEAPALNRPQMYRVMRATKAHAAYVKRRQEAIDEDSDDDEGPEDEDGWLFEDLGVLIRLYASLRDKEQLIELIFEGTTAELLKDIITIFYSPLAQVYKAASIADSLSDLQNFINDLIRTAEQGEELSQEDSSKTVQLFIDLVGRHEQAFYSFVHKVHSKGEGLFDSLMRWIELFLDFVRDGLADPDGNPQQISLEFILPHIGSERIEILKEVDAVALYHYKLKVAHESKVRKRFKEESGAAEAEDEAGQALIDNVLGELQFGSLIQGDAAEIYEEEDEETDTDSSEEESSDGSFSGSDEYEDASSVVSGAGSGRAPPSIRLNGVEKTRRSPSVSSSVHRPSHSSEHSSASSVPKRVQEEASETALPPLPPSPAPPTPHKSGFRHLYESIHKPLPPPPPKSPSVASGHRRTGSTASGLPPSVKKLRRRRKKGEVEINPPELKAIPKLLPVFVELIRNYLIPRRVSTPGLH